MKMLILTISFNTPSGEKSYDLEIPTNVPVGILLNHIRSAIYDYSGVVFPKEISLYCKRLQQTLSSEKNFLQLGIRNGEQLQIKY